MICRTQTDALMPRLEYFGYPDGWPRYAKYYLERQTIMGMLPILGYVTWIIGDDAVEAQVWQISPECDLWVIETRQKTYRLARGSENYALEAIRHRLEKKEQPRQLELLSVGDNNGNCRTELRPEPLVVTGVHTPRPELLPQAVCGVKVGTHCSSDAASLEVGIGDQEPQL